VINLDSSVALASFRTLDALHPRQRVEVATYDDRMAAAAKAIGLSLVPL
jgi:hypothetical protein